MKSQLAIAAAGLVFATAALGLTTGPLTSLGPSETFPVRLTRAKGVLASQIYCPHGQDRKYSKLHSGWVCSTCHTPQPAD